MHNVVFETPYEFVPPVQADIWPTLIQLILSRLLRKSYGVESVEIRHPERLIESLQAKCGVLLTPNHCRDSDPLVLGKLAKATGCHLYAMASWHVFMQGSFMRFMVRRMGAFSVYREGVDRKAISLAIEILEHARRPLVIFPEGARSRHNDVLMAMMDGVAFIARTAAKKRAKLVEGGRVVIHPIAIRYFFRGDVRKSIEPVLNAIEHRLTWASREGQPLVPRIVDVAEALLSLKEIERMGRVQLGEVRDRAKNFVDFLLGPLEKKYNLMEPDPAIVSRVKRLRSAILPDMVAPERIDAAERAERWRQLADCYLAQQMSLYPEDYVRPDRNIVEHLIETVERFDEDLNDKARLHPPMHVVIDVGEAIEVSPDRGPKGEVDPLQEEIRHSLESMIHSLMDEATVYEEPISG